MNLSEYIDKYEDHNDEFSTSDMNKPKENDLPKDDNNDENCKTPSGNTNADKLKEIFGDIFVIPSEKEGTLGIKHTSIFEWLKEEFVPIKQDSEQDSDMSIGDMINFLKKNRLTEID